MTITPYQPQFYDLVRRTLEGEGVPEKYMTFEHDATGIIEGCGFISLRIEPGKVPFVSHFCLFERSIENARNLYRTMRDMIMLGLGYDCFVAGILDGSEYLERFLVWISRDKELRPYAEENGIKYYLVHFRR